jgi:hypothetical protein
VIAHGLLADEQLPADLDVRAPLGDSREDLALTRRERLEDRVLGFGMGGLAREGED